MGDTEPFGDQPIAALDQVMITVTWKFPLEPVGGLARAAPSECILHDDEILRRIERLTRAKELVSKARTQPIRTGAGVPLQQQYAIDNLAFGVVLSSAQRPV